MDMTSVFAPITKTVEQDDGSILVYGKATDGGLDGDLQRCSSSWLAEAMPAWYGGGAGGYGGNIREQHDAKRAIGKAIDHEIDGDAHYITARIVDPVAVLKTKAGVFNGFSIGISRPKISKSVDAPNGVIDGGQVVEVSLVDRPANPNCLITLVKSATPGMEINAADFDEDRGLVRCEELVEKAVDTEVALEGTDMPTLAETLAPESLEKLAAAVEPAELPETPAETVTTPAVEKAADEAPLEAAPAGGDGGDTAPESGVDAAKALAADLLAKAEGDDMADMTTVAPPSDEELAALAISIIARLIQSEAGDMVSNPGEDDDIRCLLSAIGSLRWYRRRERQEGDIGGVSDAAPYEYAATPDTEKATSSGIAMGTVDGVTVTDEQEPIATKAADVLAAAPVEANELGNLAPAGAVTRIKSVSADDAKSIAKATVDHAFDELAASADRQRGADPAPPAEKAVAPETTKAVEVDADPDALVKALSAALEKADSPLRKSFQDIVTASTETTAQAVTELTARLVKVEGMAVPGGPALRRTEVERTSARRNDLAGQVMHFKTLEASTHDQTLRKGYAATAAQLEAELKALSA